MGTDGRARLWDSAAGSEMCQANFERGFGPIESGGFVKCDLSADGNLMAGCTVKVSPHRASQLERHSWQSGARLWTL